MRFFAGNGSLAVFAQNQIDVDAVDQLGLDARLGHKAYMPSQLLKFSAHSASYLSAVSEFQLDLVARQNVIRKKPPNIAAGEGD